MGLMDEMRRISENINQQLHLITDEAATVQVSIRPFIRALGYEFENLNEVRPEYTADFGTKQSEKVDYAIIRAGKPIILIEAKSAKVSLSAGHAGQLFRYYATTEARFGILTNGIQYQFYADLEKRNQMDKQPFLTIDMMNLDERLVNALEGFMKESFDSERILSSARELKYKDKIRLRLESEYQQPSKELVKCLCEQLYAGSFKKSVFEEFAPIVRKAFNEFVNDKAASRLQDAIEPGKPRQKPAAKPKHITGDSVEILVFAEYKGQRFEATMIKFDHKHSKASRILYNNNVYNISRAATVAINSVNPQIKAWNGWTFWKLRDPYGDKERPISDLRDDDALRRRLLGTD